jgi:serpin B
MFDGNDAYISQVLHKTHIELDAKGTKAAAATAVEAGAKADFSEPEHKEVILDRPFVFAIMDSYSTLPVFIGTVCDPSVQ